MIPTKLYHGSHVGALERIKRMGIAPRAIAKGRNNWDHTVTSNRNAVYLTDAYPWHFAHASSRDGEAGLLLEIDRSHLSPFKLCPDEDFMEQTSRGVGPSPERPNFAPTDWDMKRRTIHYRKIAKYNWKLADVSLETMGTAGYYGVIPWSAVTRYVIVEWDKIPKVVWFEAVDSTVSVMAYRIFADRKRALTRWFFGEPVTPAEFLGHTWDEFDPPLDLQNEQVSTTVKFWKEREEIVKQALASREGLTIVVNEPARV